MNNILALLNINSILAWDIKTVDIVFLSSIVFVLVVVLVMVIVSKVKDKLSKNAAPKKVESVVEVKTEEPVAEAKVEEPVVEAKVEEPVVEANVEEPVVEANVEEPVVEANVEEPVVEAKVEESVVEAKAEEPVVEANVEEPVVEANVEEPVVEAKVEESVVEAKVEESVVEAKGEESVVEAKVEETPKKKAPAKKKTTTSTTTAAKKKTAAAKKTETEEKPKTRASVVPGQVSVEEEVETDEEKKGRQYNGKYEVFQDADGYRYCLKASNGEQLVLSETYTTRDGVLKAIATVKKNVETGDIKIFTDKHDKYKFKLTSRNFRVLVVSSSYSAEKSAIRAAESFKSFAVKAEIVDIVVSDTDAASATPIEITSTDNKDGGKFVVTKYNGEFSWDLKASNGQILCQADGYTSKAGVLNSIEVFKKNVETGSFKCVKDKTSHFFYKLYSTQNRVCAVGESYTTKQSAESAANSVVSFYKNADVELKEE